MSYPAACRAYSRSVAELKRLIELLRLAGIHVDPLVEEVNKDHHDSVIAMINNNPNYNSLLEAARHWKGSYDNMKEEEEEWISLHRPDTPEDHEPMYGGLSDDWEEYLDMIHYDK
jgi:hypothetical protein